MPRPPSDPDRDISLQERLDDIIARTTDALNGEGYGTAEVLAALEEVIQAR